LSSKLWSVCTQIEAKLHAISDSLQTPNGISCLSSGCTQRLTRHFDKLTIAMRTQGVPRKLQGFCLAHTSDLHEYNYTNSSLHRLFFVWLLRLLLLTRKLVEGGSHAFNN
jgi:hypothetical protein